MDPEIQVTGWKYNETYKPRKRKSRPEVISLDSDSDIEITGEGFSTKKRTVDKKPPLKKFKSNSSQRSESACIPVKVETAKKEEPVNQETESDYENTPGYDMGWEQSDPPTSVEKARDIVAELELAIKRLHLGRVQLRSNPSVQLSSGATNPGLLTYRGIQRFGATTSSYHLNRSRTRFPRYHRNEFETPLKHLSAECVFHMADACTWVSQIGDRILVSSGTPGGGENDQERNPYNESNTLGYFHKQSQSPEFLPSHYLKGNDPGGDGYPDAKYYDVERACFDPNEPNVFVSTGRDGVLTIWNYATMKIKNSYSNTDEGKFSYVPVRRWGRETYNGKFVHDVVFRKNKMNDGKSVFSAPCRNGDLVVHSYSYDGDQSSNYCRQVLSNKQGSSPEASIGATVWGEGASDSSLFTCTEVEQALFNGVSHHVFDISTGKPSYMLDNQRNGEEICLNPQGSTLALFTQRDTILDLDLYDVRRKNGRSVASVKAIPCDDEEPTVTKASWSPDGILLAVAVNDHRVHVYDGRFLKSGGAPVMEFHHDVQVQRSFSITFMEWTTEWSFRGQNVGLVTGNSGDNRILLWDTRFSNQDPTVLAEICSQVSVGCLGDPSKREKPLVVGGLDGWVHAYDTLGCAF